MLKEIFIGESKSKAIILHAALIALSFAFVYMFSYSTSPLYDMLGGDSSIFQVIGKYWAQGYLPYVDLFDHKGPLLFLINAIGYAIYPRAGIMVPQIIFLYLSCLFIWRAMELYSSRRKIFFLTVALIFYAAHYEEGNHVEEYSVLFLSVSMYFFLRSLKENNFLPLYGFIYGICFGACFLIRVSDAAQICCQTFLVAIFLLQAKDFKNLRQNFLSFCAGFATIVLPFVIYFAAHGALYDMIYGTILFNLKYTSLNYHLPFEFQVAYDVFHFLPLYAIIILAALALKQNPTSRLPQSALFIGTTITFMLMSLRPYGHYAIIIFPMTPILFAVIHGAINEFRKIWRTPRLSFKRILVKFLIIFVALDTFILALHAKEYYFGEKRYEINNPDEQENISTLRKMIPKNEEKSFVTWGYYCTAPHWILRTNLKSRERVFTHNSHQMKVDPARRREWFGNVKKNYPLWILYGTAPNRKPGEPPKTNMEDTELEQLLEEKYSLRGEVYIFPQVMKLYRLKD